MIFALLLLAQTDAEREAELFGETATTAVTVPTSTRAVDRDTEILDRGETGAMERLSDAAQAANDYLDIGGDLWLFAQVAFPRDDTLRHAALSSPSFLDVYLDARPIDRVRAYGEARLSYDFTVGPNDVDFLRRPKTETRVDLDQLWLKLDVLRTVFVTAGKQRIRWGSSRIWNPTDFLNNSTRDPFNFLDLRLGVALLKLHLPIEAWGWNFYAIANLEDAASLQEIGGALRAEFAYETAELSLSVAAKRDAPTQLGADLSVGVWLLDLRAELAVTRRNPQTYYRGHIVLEPVTGTSTGDPNDIEYNLVDVPVPDSRFDEWIPQLVLGADLNLPIFVNDTLILGAEYFYNGSGYVDGNLLPLLVVKQAYNPLYMSRHYLGLSAVAIGPGDFDDTTLVAFVATSLSDHSWFARAQYLVKVLTYLDLGLFATYSFGKPGAFNLTIDVPPIHGSDVGLDRIRALDLPDGTPFSGQLGVPFSLSAPALSLGATLSLRL